MLPEILHELINAAEHRIGLDRAGELRALVDELDDGPSFPPRSKETGPSLPRASKKAADVPAGA